MYYFKIKGVILTKRNFKEKSALIYILTHELGIIKAKIDGINKIDSKLISIVQPGVFGEFFLTSESNFYKLLSLLPIKIPIKIFKKLPYTYLWSLKFLLFFNFLSVSKDFLNYIKNLDIYLLKNKRAFLIWYLKIIFNELGILPNLTNCYRCGLPLKNLKNIYYQGSRFYCYRCQKNNYEKLSQFKYKKMLKFLNTNEFLDIKDSDLIQFYKKIFKSHLKEIVL